MLEKEFKKKLKKIWKQERAANKKEKAAIQSRSIEMLEECISETRKLAEQKEALQKQYWGEAWEDIASGVKEKIAKDPA